MSTIWKKVNAPDANLLLYAYDIASPLHPASRAYLEQSLSGTIPYGLPILSVHAFVKISTSPLWGESRIPTERALKIVDTWLQRPNVRVLYPGSAHWSILHDLVLSANLSSKQFSDAAIAAIAIEHGAVIHTNDRDFARFPGLRWHNPLHT